MDMSRIHHTIFGCCYSSAAVPSLKRMILAHICVYPQLSVAGQGGSNVTQGKEHGCVVEGKGGKGGGISDCRPTGRGQSLRSSPQSSKHLSMLHNFHNLHNLCPTTQHRCTWLSFVHPRLTEHFENVDSL